MPSSNTCPIIIVDYPFARNATNGSDRRRHCAVACVGLIGVDDDINGRLVCPLLPARHP